MLITPLDIERPTRFEHNRNALVPMLVTFPGIVTLVRLLQRVKARAPILVTVLANIKLGRL